MALTALTSDLISTRHGFFTRAGGASSGVFAGLNCGRGSSDQSEIVAINRARVAQAMEVAPDSLVTVHQVHSNRAVGFSAPFDTAPPEADGLVTATPGLALGVLTADCAPVLFHDPEAGVIGAAHAGWKGALSGMVEATMDAMQALGARPQEIRVAVGPCISFTNYEVGPEFLETFEQDDPAASRFFAPGQGDRLHFNLPGYVLARARDAGADAEWINRCTYAEPEHFFSYRRATHEKAADYGRLISVIRL